MTKKWLEHFEIQRGKITIGLTKNGFIEEACELDPEGWVRGSHVRRYSEETSKQCV